MASSVTRIKAQFSFRSASINFILGALLHEGLHFILSVKWLTEVECGKGLPWKYFSKAQCGEKPGKKTEGWATPGGSRAFY
jgi:hypothetical protein